MHVFRQIGFDAGNHRRHQLGLYRPVHFDVVAFICGGSGSWLARIIYVIVALAALWCLTLLFRPAEYDERRQQHA